MKQKLQLTVYVDVLRITRTVQSLMTDIFMVTLKLGSMSDHLFLNPGKLRKGIYLFCMSLPHKSVEQREDLYTAYYYKIAAVGIFNADTMLHTDLGIVNRRLSHRRFSKITKNTYSNILHYVTLCDSSGPTIQSIRLDSSLDKLEDQDSHPDL